MNRFFFSLSLFFLFGNVFGQFLAKGADPYCTNWEYHPDVTKEQLEKMGLSNSPYLNEYESAFLNALFQDTTSYFYKEKIDFDFTNKKVYFYCFGERGKYYYFDMQKKYYENNMSGSCCNGTLYLFNDEEKKLMDGYDAAILYWQKVLYSKEKFFNFKQRRKKLKNLQ
ncbi:MAG: hypothetical protein K6E73_04735 [Bacteroidales bacterium]|nr:hypothetical protein [Bacteroidales bacterium]